MPLSKRTHVHYDEIAPIYDEPRRNHPIDANLVQFIKEGTNIALPGFRFLDMGCGTGKQLDADVNLISGSKCVGLDLSHGMLRRAYLRNCSIAWVQADSAYLPIADNSFDYITNQFSYSQVEDKPRMFTECYRILKPGGRLVITHIDPWSMPNWILYRYFPAAFEANCQDFLTEEAFRDTLTDAGFTAIMVQRTMRLTTERLSDFQTYASQRYRSSQFILLTDEDYQTGLDQIAQDIASFGPEAPMPSDHCVITIHADVPIDKK